MGIDRVMICLYTIFVGLQIFYNVYLKFDTESEYLVLFNYSDIGLIDINFVEMKAIDIVYLVVFMITYIYNIGVFVLLGYKINLMENDKQTFSKNKKENFEIDIMTIANDVRRHSCLTYDKSALQYLLNKMNDDINHKELQEYDLQAEKDRKELVELTSFFGKTIYAVEIVNFLLKIVMICIIAFSDGILAIPYLV